MQSQIGTANKIARTIPYVFTEHGVAMKHLLLNSIDYQKELFIMQNKILEHDSMFKKIFSEYSSKEYLKSKLIFENEIYDAYSFLLDILSKAKEEIIIIDNYCDKKVLDNEELSKIVDNINKNVKK